MKKYLTLALALLLVLCLCACQQQAPEEPVITEFTFPAGSAILGVDISGMNREAGWKAVQTAVEGYSLTVNVDGVEATFTAQQLDLQCSQERYNAIADVMEGGGTDPDPTGLLQLNEGKLRALINEHFNKEVTEAQIFFNEETGKYEIVPDAVGQSCNPNNLVVLLRDSILSLQSQSQLTDVSQLIEPQFKDEDPAIQEALATVTKMSEVKLTYSFTVEGKTSTLEIPSDVIRSFITLGRDGVTPDISYGTLEAYVAELSETYSAGSTKGNFQTTGGGSVGLTVTYNGVYLNQDAMVSDIADCILAGTSGSRTAPFEAAGIRDMPYGGTYIEVNLSAQKLWFYKNGSCILSTNFVSGKVSSGWMTPNGVFAIYAKEAGTYLVGEDYRTFVNYWMPFYGGYGLHDATWRGAFGGDIYLYGGSHGCVNLPLSSAATIFNNASVGTKVIVYGGRTSVPPQPQSLSGTTSYNVADDKGSFKLDIRPRYSGPQMSYSSSNPSVASVSGNTVTVNGIGTAVITVSVPSYEGYSSATINVTVKVHSACDDGRHKNDNGVVTTQPTCQPGVKTFTCGSCGATTTESIAATNPHQYGSWVTVKEPTCYANGKQEKTCTNCPDTVSEEIVTTISHVEGEGTVTAAPTCTSTGVKSYICTNSGCTTVIRTEEIPKTDHSYSYKQTQAPTCEQDGSEIQTCSCGVTYGEARAVGKLGHDWSWQTDAPAGCESTGSKHQVCNRGCGVPGATETIPAKGHSYSGGVCGNCGGSDPSYTPSTSEGEGGNA